jgi:hypothetical protein
MPFDAAGNFSRSYNFTQDRDNGIKILASHVDGEFDNFATGMNAVFFRDGRVPMQADLRLNINGITGLKDGALGSPAIKFNTDANTGVYMPGLNQFGIQVNAIQRGVFTTTGLDVTGVLSQGGAPVATQAFVTGTYAPLASPALTGVPTAPTAATGTSTTQLASTAFVQNAVAAFVPVTGGTFSGAVTNPRRHGTATVLWFQRSRRVPICTNELGQRYRYARYSFQTAGVYRWRHFSCALDNIVLLGTIPIAVCTAFDGDGYAARSLFDATCALLRLLSGSEQVTFKNGSAMSIKRTSVPMQLFGSVQVLTTCVSAVRPVISFSALPALKLRRFTAGVGLTTGGVQALLPPSLHRRATTTNGGFICQVATVQLAIV